MNEAFQRTQRLLEGLPSRIAEAREKGDQHVHIIEMGEVVGHSEDGTSVALPRNTQAVRAVEEVLTRAELCVTQEAIDPSEGHVLYYLTLRWRSDEVPDLASLVQAEPSV